MKKLIFTAAFGLAAAALAQAAPRQPAAERADGAHVYDRWCATCHADGMPGTTALQIKYAGERPARIDQWTDLAPDITRAVVRNGVGPMSRFRKTEISDAELNALATYLAKSPGKKPSRTPRN